MARGIALACVICGALAWGCAPRVVDVTDRSGSDDSIGLEPGDVVFISRPTMATAVEAELADEHVSPRQFAGMLRTAVAYGLAERRIHVRYGRGEPTLHVHIKTFSSGMEAARAFGPGGLFAVGASDIAGLVTLTTRRGRRTLEIAWVDSEQDLGTAATMIEANINYFAELVVDEIVDD